ncbi:MAG: MATE family efflux transporter [Eggerthellaceae bacterium]
MVSLSLPAIVGMVVISLYTFVDAIYAGQLIGVDAMGAVSIAYPFTFINSGLASHDRHGLGLRAVAGHRRARSRASTR